METKHIEYQIFYSTSYHEQIQSSGNSFISNELQEPSIIFPPGEYRVIGTDIVRVIPGIRRPDIDSERTTNSPKKQV